MRSRFWLVPALALALSTIPSPLPAQTPRVIRIVMTSFKFEPSAVELRQGERVILQLVNADTHPRNHNVETSLFVKAPIAVRGDVAADRTKGDVRLVAVAPGKEADVELTVPEVGTYTFICSIADHANKGQTGTFTVAAP